ncbi:Rve domain containing hypothetical protein [Phytophthora palmivora]|uniref:Integrase catalytic domain-containing protein n=1 Tax=Phytophthora palmivora TaxID=4796 RepID=A0A2P4X6X3_9STRA|nr:Rve domain containing hypothetical protein [Phytophthora palmivora]
MSGGDWPEDFKLLALNGQLEGADLNYYEKMLPVWTSVSNTLEHAMNSMLMLYMTPIPATKGIEIMASEKDRNRTWPEHYQFLVYVAEHKEIVEHLAAVVAEAADEVDAFRTVDEEIKEVVEEVISPGGSSVHLVREVSMLKNSMECNQICRTANNTMVRVTKVGAVELRTVVDGKEVVVDLTERHHGKSYVVRQSDMQRVFEVHRRNNVLMVDIMGEKTKEDAYEWSYTSGKQSKNHQSKKDTGAHAPINKIRGVIGSDIKGPMTSLDRRGNRYMINFVDYSTNYVRVFVAKNKVTATKMFEHFLVYFEKRFNCRIHVLRTDGGKEYVNVDPFCKSTGVRRQISEAGNQASNGKAERMHRTVLNMARCMLFASGLPLHFWGDAVEYATYVLNRSSCSANPKRMSPIEMLTGKTSNLADMVTFGSPCTAFRDPGKKAWKPRAQVGMIVETLNNEQNAQLQAQLEREDPELRSTVAERDESAKWKESATRGSQCEAPVAEESPTGAGKLPAGKALTTRSKKKKTRMAKNKKTSAAGDEADSSDERLLPE